MGPPALVVNPGRKSSFGSAFSSLSLTSSSSSAGNSNTTFSGAGVLRYDFLVDLPAVFLEVQGHTLRRHVERVAALRTSHFN